MARLTRSERKQRRNIIDTAVTQKIKEFFEAKKAKVFSVVVNLSASENEYKYYLFLKRMQEEIPVEVVNYIKTLPESSCMEDSLVDYKAEMEFNIQYGGQIAELEDKLAERLIFNAIDYPGLPEGFYKFSFIKRNDYLSNEVTAHGFNNLFINLSKWYGDNNLPDYKLKSVISELKKMSAEELEIFYKLIKLLMIRRNISNLKTADKIIKILKLRLRLT